MSTEDRLSRALSDPFWVQHHIGDTYRMKNAGKIGDDGWKLAYWPLFGTWSGPPEARKWVEFSEPRALVEKPMRDGIDFREVPPIFLTKEAS